MIVYYLSKLGMGGYANTTEPNLYPGSFVKMVRKSILDDLVNKIEKRILICENTYGTCPEDDHVAKTVCVNSIQDIISKYKDPDEKES